MGKRGFQTRGTITRQKLLGAARELVARRALDDISFRDIYEMAGVKPGSAYHFFRKKEDVYTALVPQLVDQYAVFLEEGLAADWPAGNFAQWFDFSDRIVDVAADFDRDDLSTFQIIPPRLTPNSDSHEAFFQAIGAKLHLLFESRFVLPELEDAERVFFMFGEMVNLFFTTALDREGAISERWINEAKWSVRAYLGFYLPAQLPVRARLQAG